MAQDPMSIEAFENPKAFYDARYGTGYMEDFSDLYEQCRVLTIEDVLQKLKQKGISPTKVLDYGCGQGRYMEVIKAFFPAASVAGADISHVALKVAASHQ